MAKKSKSPVKLESHASGEEETMPVGTTELNIPVPKGGIIDFYYLFNGIGILLSIIMIIDILFKYL